MSRQSYRWASSIGWAAAVLLAAAAGCIQEKSEYVLNPDGSGKVVHEVLYTPLQINVRSDPNLLRRQVYDEVRTIMDGSEGIAVWKDAMYRLTDQGQIQFKGTAYFPDITKLQIRAGSFRESMKLDYGMDASGRIAMTICAHHGPQEPNDGPPQAVELTDQELQERIRLERLQFNSRKPTMVQIFGNLMIERTFHLPGQVGQISNFKAIGPRGVQLTLRGTDVIAAMEKTLADEQWLSSQIRAGRQPLQQGPDELTFNELVFGQRKPVRVVLKEQASPQFDYAAEVAAARQAAPAMYAALFGADGAPPAAVPVSPPVAPVPAPQTAVPEMSGDSHVRIAGVQLISYSDSDRGIRPFGQDSGYALSLVVELPDANVEVVDGQLNKAVTDAGQDLLGSAGMAIPHMRLSKDGKAVAFEVRLASPDGTARGLKELSGCVRYLKAAGIKTIDHGTMDFKEGGRSQSTGISIRSLRTPNWDPGYAHMDLSVDLLRGSVKEVRYYGPDGSPIKVSPAGASYSQGRVLSMAFKTQEQFPANGRIVFDVLDDVKQHELPFRLANVSLTGGPMR